jgi:uncharacterized protein (TIGR03663 family)
MIEVQERVRRRPGRPDEPAVLPAEPAPAYDWPWLPFVALTAVAFTLRMWDLGSRAMHHDESLHALFSWYLYVGRGYVHDPMMHGPFLFHLTALMYTLFGDNEITARMPMVLLGTASVAMPFFLRHELGYRGAIAASLLLAFGPAFLYFSRFGHNEAMIMFQTLLIVVGVFGWIRTRRPAYFFAAVVGIALMFATKVVSLIFAFTVASFIVAAIVTYIVAGIVWHRRPPLGEAVLDAVRDVGVRRLGVAVLVFFAIAGLLYTTFLTNLDGLCTAFVSPNVGGCTGKQGMLQYWLAQQGVARGGQPWFYYFMLIPLYEVVPLALALASPFLARRPRSLFFWFCVWWALMSIGIYSFASEKMPWLIVHPTLPLVFLGALTVDGVFSRLRGWPWLPSRQWAVAGLALIGVAVFIAWLTAGGADTTPLAAQTTVLRKIALAVVFAGIVGGAFYVATGLTRRQAVASLGVAGLALLVTYSIHTAWQLTYKHGDIPVEMLVYVQSSPDAPFIVGEVERMSNTLGLRKDMPILLDNGYTDTVGGQAVVHEAVSWPFEWYFRDYKAKTYFSRTLPPDFSSAKFASILVMGTNLEPIRDQLGDYVGNKFRLNWWYPEDYKNMDWGTPLRALLDPDARAKVVKYVLYRELVNPPLGARELYFFVRKDVARGGIVSGEEAGLAAPQTTIGAPVLQQPQPAAALVDVQDVLTYGRQGGQTLLRDPKGITSDSDGRLYVADGTNGSITVLNRDGSMANSFGRKGAGEGEFNEPWGIAVAPDGSIFVADTWNHRIQKFTSRGQFVAQWGSYEVGTAPGKFYGPRDVAITPAGEVLVTDTGNKRIQVFDQRGTFVRSFGSEGTGLGQFREPVGVAVDAQGRIYVADTWNQRIQVFDSAFRLVTEHQVQGWGSQNVSNKPYISVDAETSDVYATVPERRSVVQVKDGVVRVLSLPSNPRLGLPIGVEMASDGRLLVSDSQGGVVVGYDLSSQLAGSANPRTQPE